jgi:hypothetical protein
MYGGHNNALTIVLVILPARWAGVALQPLGAASSAERERGGKVQYPNSNEILRLESTWYAPGMYPYVRRRIDANGFKCGSTDRNSSPSG